MDSNSGVDLRVPIDLYQTLHEEFGFQIDAAANSLNRVCEIHMGPGSSYREDALSTEWVGLAKTILGIPPVFWCFPPNGKAVSRWVHKAYLEACSGATIVMLLRASTDTQWFHKYIWPHAELRFLRGRLRFPNFTANSSYPTMLVVFRPPPGLLVMAETTQTAETAQTTGSIGQPLEFSPEPPVKSPAKSATKSKITKTVINW